MKKNLSRLSLTSAVSSGMCFAVRSRLPPNRLSGPVIEVPSKSTKPRQLVAMVGLVVAIDILTINIIVTVTIIIIVTISIAIGTTKEDVVLSVSAAVLAVAASDS